MSATVIPFARNLFAELDRLNTLEGHETLDELLHRHERIGKLMEEGFGQRDRGLFDWRKLEIIVHAYNHFHRHCLGSGVIPDTVAAFNLERRDWKSYHAVPGRL